MNQEDAEETIINQERAELERWCKGDPLEYSGNAADDITYFDHITKIRLDGIAAVKDHFGQFKGKVDVSKSKMVNPPRPGGRGSGLAAAGDMDRPRAPSARGGSDIEDSVCDADLFSFRFGE